MLPVGVETYITFRKICFRPDDILTLGDLTVTLNDYCCEISDRFLCKYCVNIFRGRLHLLVNFLGNRINYGVPFKC